jgi:hypothetical protein
MPLKWSISHEDRRVMVSVIGSVGRADLEPYLAELAHTGAIAYAKIIDLTFLDETTLEALNAAAARMNEYAKTMPVGPLAFVADSDLREEVGRAFLAKAQLNRPTGIFRDQDQALAWLRTIAVGNEPSSV